MPSPAATLASNLLRLLFAFAGCATELADHRRWGGIAASALRRLLRSARTQGLVFCLGYAAFLVNLHVLIPLWSPAYRVFLPVGSAIPRVLCVTLGKVGLFLLLRRVPGMLCVRLLSSSSSSAPSHGEDGEDGGRATRASGAAAAGGAWTIAAATIEHPDFLQKSAAVFGWMHAALLCNYLYASYAEAAAGSAAAAATLTPSAGGAGGANGAGGTTATATATATATSTTWSTFVVFHWLLTYAFVVVNARDPGTVSRRPEREPVSSEPNYHDTDPDSWYCRRCRERWPRRRHVKHCKACDACVEGFDHHCPLINTCVARNNHGPFVFFLTISLVYAAMFLRHMVPLVDPSASLLPAAGVGGARVLPPCTPMHSTASLGKAPSPTCEETCFSDPRCKSFSTICPGSGSTGAGAGATSGGTGGTAATERVYYGKEAGASLSHFHCCQLFPAYGCEATLRRSSSDGSGGGAGDTRRAQRVLLAARDSDDAASGIAAEGGDRPPGQFDSAASLTSSSSSFFPAFYAALLWLYAYLVRVLIDPWSEHPPKRAFLLLHVCMHVFLVAPLVCFHAYLLATKQTTFRLSRQYDGDEGGEGGNDDDPVRRGQERRKRRAELNEQARLQELVKLVPKGRRKQWAEKHNCVYEDEQHNSDGKAKAGGGGGGGGGDAGNGGGGAGGGDGGSGGGVGMCPDLTGLSPDSTTCTCDDDASNVVAAALCAPLWCACFFLGVNLPPTTGGGRLGAGGGSGGGGAYSVV